MPRDRSYRRNAGIALLLLAPLTSLAQQAPAGGASADELAKQLSNPVAALISVPLQLNYDDGYGVGGDGERFTLQHPAGRADLAQRRLECHLAHHPAAHRQDDVVGSGSQSGTGDTLQSLFFSPKKPTPNGWILGAGPAFLLPTASDNVLGSEQWAIGPTIVALKQTNDGVTYGALWNYLISVAGDDDRADVNSTFIQPFLAKAFPGGRTATINLESTYDFEGHAWNIPVNLMYSKVTKIGNQMVSFAGGARYYLETPAGGPDWGVRFVVTLLYPK